MGREQRAVPAPVAGGAKEKHRRAARDGVVPSSLEPRKLPPVKKPKNFSYLEWVQNTDKKDKKLEILTTQDPNPPPGYEFVPLGNPELVHRCKEISRALGALVMIVTAKGLGPKDTLTAQVNRYGHHVRRTIVEQARQELGHGASSSMVPVGVPEPIPASQSDINRQADAAIRELFPRIPNTDRQLIIEHAFNKREGKVGMQSDITLSRRVQLAVLAHIRHTHTRYDTLLRQVDWTQARKLVEQVCLEILVKWRGDDENGRDQLDEILREVVVISDSDSEEEGDDESDEDAGDEDSGDQTDAMVGTEPDAPTEPAAQPMSAIASADSAVTRRKKGKGKMSRQQPPRRAKARARETARSRQNAKARRKQAAMWEEAVRRNRRADPAGVSHIPPDVDGSVSRGFHQVDPEPFRPQPDYSLDYIRGQPPAAMHPGPRRDFASDEYDPRQPLIGNAISAGTGVFDQTPRPLPPGPPMYAVNPPQPIPLPPRRSVFDGPDIPLDYGPPPVSPIRHAPHPLPSHRYQDSLVPSIEPASPDAVHLRSFQNSPIYPPQPFLDLTQRDHPGVQHPRRYSPEEVVSYRDRPTTAHRRVFSETSIHAGALPGPIDTGPNGLHHISYSHDQHVPSQPAREHVPMRSYHEPPPLSRVYVPDGEGLARYGAPYQEDGALRSRTNPITVEDPGMYPARVPLRPHQDIRDRLGLDDDCEILEVRRPAPEHRLPTGRREVVVLEDSPMRPRERADLGMMETFSAPRPFVPIPERRVENLGREFRHATAVSEQPPIFVRRIEQSPPAQQHHYEIPIRHGDQRLRTIETVMSRDEFPRNITPQVMPPQSDHYGERVLHDPGYAGHPPRYEDPRMAISGPIPVEREYIRRSVPPPQSARQYHSRNVVVLE